MSKKEGRGRPKIPMITKSIGTLEDKLPPKPIILEQVLYWMNLNATAEEIAGSFYVSTDTLDRRLTEEVGLNFAELKKKCCGSAKLTLRNNQFKLSAKNATMAIWLGKIWLGQQDPDKIEVLGDVVDEIRQAVRDILGQPRVITSEGPSVEDKQLILDQESRREETEI